MIVEGKYIGKVLLSENLNENNERLIPELKAVGIRKCVLLTEDSKEESESLGKSLNADEVYAEFTDETKLAYLESVDSENTMYLYQQPAEAQQRLGRYPRQQEGQVRRRTGQPGQTGALPAGDPPHAARQRDLRGKCDHRLCRQSAVGFPGPHRSLHDLVRVVPRDGRRARRDPERDPRNESAACSAAEAVIRESHINGEVKPFPLMLVALGSHNTNLA